MRPKGWSKMSKEQRAKEALDLFQAPRGKYIVAQALHYGIKSLKSVKPDVMQEKSNIEDMEMLQELFNFPIMEPEETRRMFQKAMKAKENQASAANQV